MEGTAGSWGTGGQQRVRTKRAGAPWKRLRPPFFALQIRGFGVESCQKLLLGEDIQWTAFM